MRHTVDFEHAGINFTVAGNEPKRGRFPAAVRAQQSHDFAGFHTKGKIVQNLAGSEEFIDALEDDGRHWGNQS